MMDATVVISTNRRNETVSTSNCPADHEPGDVGIGEGGECRGLGTVKSQTAWSATGSNFPAARRTGGRVVPGAVEAKTRCGGGLGDRPIAPLTERERIGGPPPTRVEGVKGAALLRSLQESRPQGAMSNLYPTPHTVAMLHG